MEFRALQCRILHLATPTAALASWDGHGQGIAPRKTFLAHCRLFFFSMINPVAVPNFGHKYRIVVGLIVEYNNYILEYNNNVTLPPT